MTIKSFIYKNFQYLKYFLQDTTKVSWSVKTSLFLSGFFPSKSIIFNFSKYQRDSFVNDYNETVKVVQINKPHHTLLMNKITFNGFLKPYISVPKVFGIIKNKGVYQYENHGISNIDELIDYLKVKGPLIFKPISGDGGLGILKVEFKKDDGKFQVNQKLMDTDALMDLILGLDDYFISEFAVQAAYSSKIYDKSVNTVRLLTMIDVKSKKAFIAAAAHRIGNNKSFPVDNCAMGGFTAEIDIETGRLGKAVAVKKIQGNKLKWFTHHPDTGNPIEGVVIPNWDAIKDTILKMAENLKDTPYLGWDIVVTESSFTVLEANDGADLKLHQVHKPLLLDPKVKAFYNYYGSI